MNNNQTVNPYEKYTMTPFKRILILTLSVLVLNACNTSRYKEKADIEAYKLINEKSPAVPGMTTDTNIDSQEKVNLTDLPKNKESYPFLGSQADSEIDSSILTLDKALATAFKQSREYQTRKEDLYIQALSLSLERHRFDPIFSGSVDGTVTWDEETGDDFVNGRTQFGVQKLMRHGGLIAVGITSNFFQYISGDSEETATSNLIATFTQPLLRGRGHNIAFENLTQAERNLLYEVRDFTRFRKTFTVRVSSNYYTVLRNKDTVRNNYYGLESFEISLKRERAFEAEGERTPGEVSRLEQSKLTREALWINSTNRYQESLDEFKILLGLSTDAKIILDDTELETISQMGIIMPELNIHQAIDIALVTRLDLYTEVDLVQDAERRILVASNGLLPNMDLLITSNIPSKSGNRFTALDFSDRKFTAGIDLELPFNQKANRNVYRRSLIDLNSRRRSAELSIDLVKLEVRNSWRSLEQSKRDYEISQISVNLNERRVEEVNLKAEIGQGSILDQVDAQNDLTNAQTAFTNSLVNHNISLLEFWRDLGVLYIKENGQWETFNDA